MNEACRRCDQAGHLFYDCRTPRCARCGDYGHVSSECRAPCKLCDGDHPTSQCPVSTCARALTVEAHETQREDGGHEGDNPFSKEDEEADMPAAALRPGENSETQRGGASSETHLTCTREVRDFEGKVPVTGFYSFGEHNGAAILVSLTYRGSVGKYQHDEEGRLLPVDFVHKGNVLRAKDSLGGTRKEHPWKAKGLVSWSHLDP
ncbi:hypothetical protein IscW_ISCW000168 [Ixodes scapularis]|uniref:CCHC-type domain-containing protein n=1 Tax=Ixodes scapularis TaxID=6945 RepID=B7P5N1_IXOSC|nr:hypothetical protein IscW_ISCW000168 [Ixodes scapularis]|eukprot:XP_002407761.1 hypothetical protein IscW_ISCW000168 [Ixodes scapularis]